MLTRAVRRGLKTPLLVGDLPFGSYEATDAQAIETAHRFVKEAGCDAVKLEGGGASAERARAIVRAGVPVMGHVGLTPQTATMLGGYRAQGRTAARARQVLDDALALQEAGCFSIVFEAIPSDVTDAIMPYMEIPIIGIGAGPSTDGQVLVLHDLLTIHDDFQPKFAKRFAAVKDEMRRGVDAYAEEVRTRAFPAPEHTYGIAPEELERFKAELPSPRENVTTVNNVHIHWPRDEPARRFVRVQGTRVLRPLRGGGAQLRARRRPARDDARALARPRRRCATCRLRAGGRPHHARHHPAAERDVRDAVRPRGHHRPRVVAG